LTHDKKVSFEKIFLIPDPDISKKKVIHEKLSLTKNKLCVKKKKQDYHFIEFYLLYEKNKNSSLYF
jgi:hypothetical protein